MGKDSKAREEKTSESLRCCHEEEKDSGEVGNNARTPF